MGVHQQLNPHFLGTFHRLLRIYPTLNILSALMSGLSIASLTLPEFHPVAAQNPIPDAEVPIYRLAEGFFTSAAATSVISIMLCTMLQFCFESRDTATRLDLVLLWSPLVLLDWSIVAFLMGLLVWYGEKNEGWRTIVMGTHVAFLLAFGIGTSGWMWRIMKPGGRLERMMIEREKRRMEEGHANPAMSAEKRWMHQMAQKQQQQQDYQGPMLPPGYGPAPIPAPMPDRKWSHSTAATLTDEQPNWPPFVSAETMSRSSAPMGSGDWCHPHNSFSPYGNPIMSNTGKGWSPPAINREWTASPSNIIQEEAEAEKTMTPPTKKSPKSKHRHPHLHSRRQNHETHASPKDDAMAMAGILSADDTSREKSAAIQKWVRDREREGREAPGRGLGASTDTFPPRSGSGSGSVSDSFDEDCANTSSSGNDSGSESGTASEDEGEDNAKGGIGKTKSRREKTENGRLPSRRFRLRKSSTGLSQATTIAEER